MRDWPLARFACRSHRPDIAPAARAFGEKIENEQL